MITGWTDFCDERYEELSFRKLYDTYPDCEEIISKELREKGYKFTGYYHQNGDYGCPIFNHQHRICLTQREWGDIMAQALCIDDPDGYAYLKWAWVHPDGEDCVVPNPDDYK